MLPDGQTYHLFNGTSISSSTLPSVICSLLYMISIPFIFYTYNEKNKSEITKTDKLVVAEGKKKTTPVKNTNWKKIIIIIYNSLTAGLTWDVITLTLVEYG